MNVQQGCLLLADISGYTKYLSGVELEHSHDVLADLLENVVGRLGGAMALAKLEGDAIFMYDVDPGDDDYGKGLVAMIEATYFSFQRRIRTITHLTTCTCDACSRIPTLGLKFVVHYGEFIRHEVMRNLELLGPDVVVAHRLLKNNVTPALGLRDYALYTRVCVHRLGLVPAHHDLVEHREAYDDVGEIECFLQDLYARWTMEQKEVGAYMGPGEGMLEVSAALPGPVEEVWDFLTSPHKRPLWQPGVLRVVREDESAPIGAGTTAHCVHGDHVTFEEIVDWRPLEYVSLRWTGPLGRIVGTIEVAPAGERSTRVWVRMDVEGDPETRSRIEPAMKELEQAYEAAYEQLAGLVAPSPA